MGIRNEYYGRTQDGQDIYQYTLENKNGVKVSVIEYGCIITNIFVPDKNGILQDVVLGYADLADYEKGGASLGAFVGRCANRIENAQFTIDDKTFHLAKNDGENHLHGTFGKMVYKGSVQENSLILKATSPDGDDGFPGTVEIIVTYTLTDENGLVMDYIATTDATTLINLTNHSYFNLEGQESRNIYQQTLQMEAMQFTPINERVCASGEILPVAGTAMDFTKAKPIGQDIGSEEAQIQLAGGYDHNFVLEKEGGSLALAATAKSETTGITMETYTTQPGVQLYTSNFLEGDLCPGKTGKQHGKHQAFCLETQHFPCAPSHPHFPSILVHPEEEYHEITVYKFIVDGQ